MALVVEDGTGIEGANSFATDAEIIAYALKRGVEITGEEVERLSTEAMDYIGMQCFRGLQLFELPFPRVGVVFSDGTELAPNVVPTSIKKAQMQLALDAKRGVKLVVSASGDEAQLKAFKLGPVEEQYFAPPTNLPTLPIANAALAAFLCGSEPIVLRTYRV
jgi:hypothetical protein